MILALNRGAGEYKIGRAAFNHIITHDQYRQFDFGIKTDEKADHNKTAPPEAQHSVMVGG